jgi:hypothetical protein
VPTELTFDSLKDTMQAYAERGSATYDPTVYDEFPWIINTAERRMAREMKIQGFENVVNGTLTTGLLAYQKPDRWRSTISMSIGTGTGNNTQVFLREMAYEAACVYWPDRSSTAQPRYYADYDYEHWAVFPVPDAAYPWEIVYWQLPPLLDSGNQTNWLTEYAPNALLHGCLVELFGFLRNQQDMEKWKVEYDRDMAALVGEDVQKIIDRYYRRQTS